MSNYTDFMGGSAGGSGGLITSTASESININDFLVISGNNTVAPVTGNNFTIGNDQKLWDSNADTTVVLHDPVNNVMVFAGYNWTTTNMEIVAASVSGTTLTFGTPVSFYGSSMSYLEMTYDTTTDQFILMYANTSTSYARTAKVSGTSITLGTAVNTGLGGAYKDIAIEYDSINNRVVAISTPFDGSYLTRMVVASVSGTSLTFGSYIQLGSETTYGPPQIAFEPNSGKCVICYYVSNNWRLNTATISDMTITLGTYILAGIPDSSNPRLVVNTESNDILFSNYSDFQLLEIIGGDIAVKYSSTVDPALTVDNISGKKLDLFYINENKYGYVYPYSNTELRYVQITTNDEEMIVKSSEEKTLFLGDSYSCRAAYNTTDAYFCPHFRQADSINNSNTLVCYIESSNNNKLIGQASESASTSSELEIRTISTIAEGQSGLIAGSNYYVNPVGQLTSESFAEFSSNVLLGKALNSSQLLITL